MILAMTHLFGLRRFRPSLRAFSIACLWLAVLGAAPALAQPSPDTLGVLWVGESEGVLKLGSSDGSLMAEITSVQNVGAVAVDEGNRLLWVFSEPDLHAFGLDGLPQFSVSLGASGTTAEMDVNPVDETVWLGVGSTLFHVDSAGQLLQTVGHSGSIKTLAVDWVDGLLWVSSGSSSIAAYDAITGSYIKDHSAGSGAKVNDLDFQSDRSIFLAATSKGLRRFLPDGTLIGSVNLGSTALVSWLENWMNIVWLASGDDLLKVTGGIPIPSPSIPSAGVWTWWDW
jgi:hypothetical protein